MNMNVGPVGRTEQPIRVNAVADVTPNAQSGQASIRWTDPQGKSHSMSEGGLVKSIEQALQKLRGTMTNLEFSIHEKTGNIMVKVMETETGTVIREIPPEKMLDLVAKLWELAGIFIDERK